MPPERQSPIFVRTYDLLQWLLPHTKGWPRSYRFTLTQELVRAALRFQERILEATLTNEAARRLEQADVDLAKMRLYLRLGYGSAWTLFRPVRPRDRADRAHRAAAGRMACEGRRRAISRAVRRVRSPDLWAVP